MKGGRSWNDTQANQYKVVGGAGTDNVNDNTSERERVKIKKRKKRKIELKVDLVKESLKESSQP